jgi:hypothetical protein
MLNKVIVTSLLTSLLLLSGCGGDSEGESALETQQMLDDGNFDGVIAKLAPTAHTNDEYITLASAYMGRAGFSLYDIVNSFIVKEDENDDGAFANYTKNVNNASSITAFDDLKIARKYYTKIVEDRCLDEYDSLSSSEKNICLYMGLSITTRTALALKLLTDNIDSFGGEGGDLQLQATTCAMQYAVDPAEVNKACVITEQGSVTFSESQKTYNLLDINVTLDGESGEFSKLLQDHNRTVLTEGYCTLDSFDSRVLSMAGGLYPCPLNEDINGTDESAETLLVDALNNSLDIVVSLAPEDVQGDGDEFKCEVIGGEYIDDTCSKTGDIDETSIVDYLNKENSAEEN